MFRRVARDAAGRGFSLVEVMVVLVILSILIALAVPRYTRAIEQSRADAAAANLRAIWAAEQLYWLDQRSYTADLASLSSLGLLDPGVLGSALGYAYDVSLPTDGGFTATASRTGSDAWSGQYTIDETGSFAGSVTAPGEPVIVPGFQ
jgi:type IV pilus assembly protein PilE